MRKFKNAVETLDALEDELRRMKKEGARLKIEFVPCPFIVALYRLAETQISLGLETGTTDWEQDDRFERHEKLGAWIAEQPE